MTRRKVFSCGAAALARSGQRSPKICHAATKTNATAGDQQADDAAYGVDDYMTFPTSRVLAIVSLPESLPSSSKPKGQSN